MTLAGSLLDALEARGETVFLRRPSGDVSAADVLERVRRAADGLGGCGLSGGEVIALWRVPPADAVPLLLAAWSSGLVVHLADPREPVEPLTARLDEVRARLLVTGDAEAAWLSGSTSERLSGSVPAVLSGSASSTPPESTAGYLCGSAPAVSVGGLTGSVRIDLPDRAPLDLPVGAATLIRTSGSSGRPKLAVHSLSQFVTGARAAIDALDVREGDGWLLSLPYHHVGGLSIVFRTLLGGAELLISEEDQSLGAALSALVPTHVSLVPTQLFRLLGEAPGVLASPRRVLLGGSSLSASLRRRGLDARARLAVSYGSTETTAFVAVSAEPEVVARPGSAGRPLPERDLVVDADGEIRVGGPTLFLGYLEEGRLRNPRGGDGRFATGDLGSIDGDGVLYVLGRRDRMFISGGENIHPGEIEAALESISGVEEAVVVALADAEFGARPVAFVACASPAPSRGEIEARLRSELAGYKVPSAFYRLSDAAGSLKRRPQELLAMLESGKDLRPL